MDSSTWRLTVNPFCSSCLVIELLLSVSNVRNKSIRRKFSFLEYSKSIIDGSKSFKDFLRYCGLTFFFVGIGWRTSIGWVFCSSINFSTKSSFTGTSWIEKKQKQNNYKHIKLVCFIHLSVFQLDNMRWVI